MSWTTPILDWNATTQNNPGPSDFNRIEGNTKDNHDRVVNIEDGTTVVPNADHAGNTDTVNNIGLAQVAEAYVNISADSSYTLTVDTSGVAFAGGLMVSLSIENPEMELSYRILGSGAYDTNEHRVKIINHDTVNGGYVNIDVFGFEW